jgi:hypothetical protein
MDMAEIADTDLDFSLWTIKGINAYALLDTNIRSILSMLEVMQ